MWWAERPWGQRAVSTFSCTVFPLPAPQEPSSPRLAAPWEGSCSRGAEVRPLRKPSSLLEPLGCRMEAPRKVSFPESGANGGVPVRVKDAAVARQRLLFPLGVWL